MLETSDTQRFPFLDARAQGVTEITLGAYRRERVWGAKIPSGQKYLSISIGYVMGHNLHSEA